MSQVMKIVEVAHESLGYHELVRLRDLHLRQPIGLRLETRDLTGEENHRHFAIEEGGKIVGGLIAQAYGPGCIKLRQMWIQPDFRNQGHGRDLLAEVEARLSLGKSIHFILHARENAAAFYRKCGYREVGDLFIEVGRPHVRMEKRTGGSTADEKPACRNHRAD